MSKFGWCMDGHHKDCKRRAMSLSDSRKVIECDCECHR